MQYVKGMKGVNILSHMFLLQPQGTQKELQPHGALQTSLITLPHRLQQAKVRRREPQVEKKLGI